MKKPWDPMQNAMYSVAKRPEQPTVRTTPNRRDIVERIREESTLVRAARDAGAGLTILKWRQARLTDALIDLQRLEEEKP